MTIFFEIIEEVTSYLLEALNLEIKMQFFITLCVVIVVCLCASNAFSIGKSALRTSSSLNMVWGAKETNEKYLIAPSILSANFARLGEEV